MAIQFDLAQTQYGIPFDNAYCRIAVASISRTRDPQNRHTVMLDVASYATKPENDNVRELAYDRFHVPLTEIEAQQGEDFLSKCYAWVTAQMGSAKAV